MTCPLCTSGFVLVRGDIPFPCVCQISDPSGVKVEHELKMEKRS